MKINDRYTHNVTKRVAVIEKMVKRKPTGYSVTFRYIGDMYSLKLSKSTFERSHKPCQK